MERNNFPSIDSRKVMHGSNGALYDADKGKLMASVENFTAQVSVTTQPFKPLGTTLERAIPTSMKLTLTFTEVVVQSGLFLDKIAKWMHGGALPSFNFRGSMISPYDGSEESVVYRDCVPDGTIDIQNMTAGELYKRSWSFIVNNPPDFQSFLKN